jgi:uncharacterized protein (DUF1015 family)
METQEHVQKGLEDNKIVVHATKDGKLYILASDLFSLDKVKNLLVKVNQSQVLQDVPKLEAKE